MSNVRLELVWPNKDKFLLSPQDEAGKPVWVERSHPAAREVRLTEFTDAVGQVDDQNPERDNLLFVGDSLDALRILNETPAFRREYRGKVKLIYIDPPFNTGQAFEHYDDWMEHSTWLSFMRDRLILMKELLAPDGSIWVHLDDAEQHRMRVLLDEVFGSDRFMATIVWQKRYSRSNDAIFSGSHDTIHVYSPNPRDFAQTRNRLGRDASTEPNYKNPDNDPKGPWRGIPFDAPGVRGPSLSYGIQTPSGEVRYPPAGRHWASVESNWNEIVKSGLAMFGKNGSGNPQIKKYLADMPGLVPDSLWLHSEVGHNDEATRALQAMFGAKEVFDTPKPERLIERIVHVATNPGDIVLDVFGGSGTTAAVAHKMRRRWITAEIQVGTVQNYISPRMRMVVEGEDAAGVTSQARWLGGGGFRTVEIQDSFYALTPLGIMLTDYAEGQRFARSVAAQLGFDWTPTAGLVCAKRGRMRLAVLDGAVGVEEAREIVSELDESERVTIVARVILEGAEEWLSENSRGSICLKAPNDVLRERRKRRRSMGGEA
jgi:adenine-specific DNA-methyltransferase